MKYLDIVLGVPRDASKAEIKKHYFELAKKYHPDQNKGDENAKQKFIEVSEAYEVLKDDEKRARYDQFGEMGVNDNGAGYGQANVDMDELLRHFADIFGGEARSYGGFGGFGGFDGFGGYSGEMNNSGSDIAVSISIPFLDGINGCQRDLRVSKEVECSMCHGSGTGPNNQKQQCPQCKGKGMIYSNRGIMMSMSPCPRCNGSGSINTDVCTKCHGSGTQHSVSTISVKIPAGIDNGDTIRLVGQGNKGPQGGSSGNLYINVEPDSFFSRRGADIYCNVPISVTTAILGGTITVPTLSGAVDVHVPAGTQCNTKMRLRSKGIRPMRSTFVGDQIITFDVHIPKNITEEQRRLITEFGKDEKGVQHPKAPAMQSVVTRIKSFLDSHRK
ncbi:molecular chaperone [Blastocystis sp. subtype 4]|uniref:molecular chaperone n=1 Tax=Blastocystis sp. subtype 4 TaxID=944170 RepID=UPI0007112FCF|nr:molecular chaperone [Blastocystis sp. subtype 4]KNB44711.1 molecular chaperone [Blastocystis sp. subtype 4]|eukprot:XP_014528154.1 molecular chaperone [Blastocystis sp. subtype 4]